MNPRPYQSEALSAIYAAYETGVNRQLLVLPTGTGKTVCFALLIRQFLADGRRALVLAHRDRLIQQAAQKINQVVDWQDIGIVKAEQNRRNAACVVASVQTLARQRRLNSMPKFDLVIIDEAHRSAAKTYQRIINHVVGPQTLLLGVTATPDRSDGGGLDKVFQEIVYEMSLLDAIEQGFLVDLRAIRVTIDADFSKLHTRKNTDGINDYREDEIVDLMESANWYNHVSESWFKFASDRPTIVFVPRVKMAYYLAEHLREKGVPAAALDGSSPLSVQRATVADFEAGRLKVLVNCDLFVEGADIPSISCVVMARPTKSRIVYSQAVGRGTRLSPGKTDCLILDLVGASNRLDLCTAASLIGCRPLEENESLTSAVKRQKKEDEQAAEESAQQLKIEGDLVGREVDLFGGAPRPRKRGFEWEVYPELRQSILRAAGRTFEIWKVDEQYHFADMSWKGDLNGIAATYSEAREQCEQAAREILFGPDAAWRSKPASEGQIKLLQRLRINHAPDITKGQASDLINARLGKKEVAA